MLLGSRDSKPFLLRLRSTGGTICLDAASQRSHMLGLRNERDSTMSIIAHPKGLRACLRLTCLVNRQPLLTVATTPHQPNSHTALSAARRVHGSACRGHLLLRDASGTLRPRPLNAARLRSTGGRGLDYLMLKEDLGIRYINMH